MGIFDPNTWAKPTSTISTQKRYGSSTPVQAVTKAAPSNAAPAGATYSPIAGGYVDSSGRMTQKVANPNEKAPVFSVSAAEYSKMPSGGSYLNTNSKSPAPVAQQPQAQTDILSTLQNSLSGYLNNYQNTYTNQLAELQKTLQGQQSTYQQQLNDLMTRQDTAQAAYQKQLADQMAREEQYRTGYQGQLTEVSNSLKQQEANRVAELQSKKDYQTQQEAKLSQYYEAQKAAQEAQRQAAQGKAVNTLEQQMQILPQQYEGIKNQASLDAVLNQRNIDEQMANAGNYYGGANAEAQRQNKIAGENKLNTANLQKQNQLNELTNQINQLKANGSQEALALANQLEASKANAMYELGQYADARDLNLADKIYEAGQSSLSNLGSLYGNMYNTNQNSLSQRNSIAGQGYNAGQNNLNNLSSIYGQMNNSGQNTAQSLASLYGNQYNVGQDSLQNSMNLAQLQNTMQQQGKQDFTNTLGAYSNDYQAKINELKNDNDPTNDWQIAHLQQARQQKIQGQEAAAQAQAQAQAQAEAKARQQEFDNSIAAGKLNLDAKQIDYNVGKPYYNPTPSASSQKASSNNVYNSVLTNARKIQPEDVFDDVTQNYDELSSAIGAENVNKLIKDTQQRFAAVLTGNWTNSSPQDIIGSLQTGKNGDTNYYRDRMGEDNYTKMIINSQKALEEGKKTNYSPSKKTSGLSLEDFLNIK